MIPKFYPNAKWWVIKDRRMPRRNDPRAWIKIGTYHPWDFEPIDEIPDAIREHYEASINGIGIASIRGLTKGQLDILNGLIQARKARPYITRYGHLVQGYKLLS